MFKVKWDALNNGIILSDNITDDEAIPAPRPVYLQELQILEVNKKFRIPKTDLPNAILSPCLNNFSRIK